jgi:uncharacterized protein (TIGR02246 family)
MNPTLNTVGEIMTIQEIINYYERALNASSTEEVLQLYGETPVFMPQHSTALIGREAVRAGYEHVFQAIQLNVKFTVHEIQEFGEWAFVRTASAGTTKILATGANVEEGNNELFIFHKENGDWKIHRYLFATSKPFLN